MTDLLELAAPAADGLNRFALEAWLIDQPAPTQAEIRDNLARLRGFLRDTQQEITRNEALLRYTSL